MDARIPTGRDDNVTTGGLRIKFPADGRTYPGRGRIATAGRIAAISLPRSLHKVHPADFVEGAAAHPVIIDARRERGGVEGHAGQLPVAPSRASPPRRVSAHLMLTGFPST